MTSYTKQIRTTAEEARKFDTLANELHLSQGEAFTAMIRAWEMSKGREQCPSQQETIESFQRLQNTLGELFLSTALLCESQREIAEASVKNQLESKDAIIIDLQEQLKAAQDKAQEAVSLETELKDVNARLALLMEDNQNLRAITQSIPDPTAYAHQEQQIATLQSQVAEKEQTIKILIALAGGQKDDTSPLQAIGLETGEIPA